MKVAVMRTVVVSLFGFCLLGGVVPVRRSGLNPNGRRLVLLVVADQGSKVKDPNVKTEVDPMEGAVRGSASTWPSRIPDKTLTKEQLAKVGKKSCWWDNLSRNAAPAVPHGAAPAAEKTARDRNFHRGRRPETPPLLSLGGVQKNDKGDLELLIYGKEKEPLVKQVLKKVDGKQELPIELEIKPSGDARRADDQPAGRSQRDHSRRGGLRSILKRFLLPSGL
ncbi:MAG: hypothetical protein U0903_08850 [Planctomycetales bacterium]